MDRKKLTGYLGLMVAASVALAACSGGTKTPADPGTTPAPNPGTTTPPPPAAKTPDFGGEMSFSVPSDPDTFAHYWLTSAYAFDVTGRVFSSGLLRIGVDLKPEPYLAEAMPEVSADSKTYTFKVRKDVKFHDGTPMTAEHIKYSYDLLMSPDYQGPDKTVVADLAKVELIDSHTIAITTKEVFAPFLFSSASVEAMPMHLMKDIPIKDLQQWDGWKHPIGIGPWKFVEWKSGQYTLLERNPDYFELNKPGVMGGVTGPFVDKLRIKVIPDSNTEMAALEAGEITFLDSVEPEHVDRLKKDYSDKLQDYNWNRMGYGYQTFNNQKFPTDIKAVRQALSMGLNRPAIIEGIMDKKASLPAGFVPPIHWLYDKNLKGYAYDPAAAIKLIEGAGGKKNASGIYEINGQPLKVTYVGTKGSAIVEGIALASQKDWKEIGVETELIMVDFNTLLDKHLKPGDYHVTFSGLGFSVDPHTSFQSWHSSEIRLDAQGVSQGNNRARYSNPEVDKLIEQGKVTIDTAKRKEIYNAAEKLIVEDAPANWIYVNQWTDFADKKLKGVVNWDGYGMSYDQQWYFREK